MPKRVTWIIYLRLFVHNELCVAVGLHCRHTHTQQRTVNNASVCSKAVVTSRTTHRISVTNFIWLIIFVAKRGNEELF
jgi:hypothetical protein